MKRTPLAKQSTKRRKENQQYRRLATSYLAAYPFCQVCRDNRSTQIHHKDGRNGDRLLISSDWLAVCNACHDHIHTHGIWARAQGYLV